MGKGSDDRGLGRGVKQAKDPPDHEYFLALIKEKTPIKEAKRLAGFSPHTKTKEILKTKKTMQAAKTRQEVNMVLDARKPATPQEAREMLCSEPGYRFQDNAKRLAKIMDDPYVAPNVAIGAIKELNAMMGNNAPQQVQVESKSLVLELNGITEEQLRYIAENGMKL